MEYDSRSGLVALLHRLGLEYRKPEVIPRHLDENKQRAFTERYENLMNSLSPDEVVVLVDAVHPTHAARAAGCWAAKDETLAIERTTGRQRLNIHGAIDLETGRTKMIEAEAIDAASTIKLLEALNELCGKVGDGVNQAADLISATASIPSLNFIPLTTFGNCYLRGISAGDFQEALAALLGKDAPNLCAAVIGLLKSEWEDGFDLAISARSWTPGSPV